MSKYCIESVFYTLHPMASISPGVRCDSLSEGSYVSNIECRDRIGGSVHWHRMYIALDSGARATSLS